VRNQRDLAEASRRGVGLDQLAQHRFAAAGFHVDDAPVRKRQAEVLDQRAAVAERFGGADGAADAMPIRDREHFLGRQVRDEADVVAARRRPAHPQVRRRQPDGQIGPGPVKRSAV
jgi:hypothetical protein